VGRVFTVVCLFFSTHDISKTDAARITKLDIQMFHVESWKPIYFGVKVSTSVGLQTEHNIAAVV